MRSIILSVKRSKFRMDDARSHESERAYMDIRPRIVERDQETCQFCDISIRGKMETHHLDGRHHVSTEDNLVTACRLCHLAHHIGYVGLHKAGILIRLPGIEQSELNHLLRTLWVGEESNLIAVRDQCAGILRLLTGAADGAKELLGLTDPKLLGDYLLQLNDDAYKRRISVLSDIRILYHREQFQDHIDDVRPLYRGYPQKQWQKIAAVFADRTNLALDQS